MLKLFKGLKKYSFSIISVVILIFIQAFSELYLPNLMSKVVDIGIVNGDTNYIIRTGGIMLLVTLVGSISTITASYLSAKVAMGFSRDLRQKVFTKVEGFSLKEVSTIGTASLITRTTNDIVQIQQVLIVMLRMMIFAPILAIGAVVMAVSKDSQLSLVIVFVVPIVALIIFIIGKRALPLFQLMQKKLDRVNLVAREKLMGIRVIRAFDKVDYERKRFNNSSKDLSEVAIKANRTMTLLMPLLMGTLNLSIVVVMYFGSRRIDLGSLQVGDLMAFIQYINQIMFAMIMLSMMFVMIPRASASAVRINEVLDVDYDITNITDAKAANEKKGYVEFKDVTFSYPGAENPSLQHISFTAGPGETTAIIGATGSGKSTLINLIPRFFDVTEGEVLVDGVNVENIKLDVLRHKIGYVPQKAVLFSGTIKENVKYGKESATDEEIHHALDIAQATEFVSNMKEGIKSYIAQGGTNVSGGQKQRLSIARALVRKPEIYIFDDSFSALDFKTDAKLRKALKAETTEATVLIVAQRVSSIMDADRIIVLEEGKVVGMGTHKELLKTCEVYREIASSQLSKEEM